MNGYTMIYNAPTSAKHSFQINGTENTYINSTGITSTGNLICANTYSNNVYLNDVAITTNNPMQLFGYGNNIYLATSNSNSTGSIYFRNQTLSPFTYNDFATFSQAGSNINSSLVLNNALTCTNITCNKIQVNPTLAPPNVNYIGYTNMV